MYSKHYLQILSLTQRPQNKCAHPHRNDALRSKSRASFPHGYSQILVSILIMDMTKICIRLLSILLVGVTTLQKIKSYNMSLDISDTFRQSDNNTTTTVLPPCSDITNVIMSCPLNSYRKTIQLDIK